jgi:exodeoxyribonuclease VII small subunit
MADTSPKPGTSAQGPPDLTFEEAFRELEGVVQRLEAGDLSLEEALALYERGITLARQCGGQLDAAELRVRQLAPEADYRDLLADAE